MTGISMNLWQTINQWDQWLFEKINHGLANPFFDVLMPFLRNSSNWAPLYLFLLVFILLNFKARGAWWCIFFLATVALTDMTGTYLLKHQVERLRPCNDPDFAAKVRLVLQHCAGGYSFISNHAANHFGMATFVMITLRPVIGKWVWMGMAWAASIALAQVYVGIHYPFDVLAGSILGIGYGYTIGSFFNKRSGFAIFDN